MDAVTAISGSGPAYFFFLVELLIKEARRHGLDKRCAYNLAVTTAVGSARLLDLTKEDPALLRAKVTSKGGTTEAAFKVFRKHKLDAIIKDAVSSAIKRAGQLRRRICL